MSKSPIYPAYIACTMVATIIIFTRKIILILGTFQHNLKGQLNQCLPVDTVIDVNIELNQPMFYQWVYYTV